MRDSLFGISYLRIPVNQAYEDETGDLADVNMIDPYHLEIYGKTTVNYNRDVEAFPVLKQMFTAKLYMVIVHINHLHIWV